MNLNFHWAVSQISTWLRFQYAAPVHHHLFHLIALFNETRRRFHWTREALAGKLVTHSVITSSRNVQSPFKCCIQRTVKRHCNTTTSFLLSHHHRDSMNEKPETEQKTASQSWSPCRTNKSRTSFWPDSTRLLDFWMHKLLRLSGGQQFPAHSGRRDVLA